MARLPQYRNQLTLVQIAEGMTRALNNAERLAEDAETLLKAGSVPSAVALAILSIEESGKVPILRQMATAVGEKEWAELWKAYRSHTKKNTLWIFGELVQSGARTLDELCPVADPDSEHPGVLDQLKQLSIYTDCFKDAKWSSPAEVDLNGSAHYLVKMAQILGRPKIVAAEEIQLWQKHLLPVKGAPMEMQKAAVAAWFHEMKLLGLSEASPEEVEAFLGGYGASTQV
ncbi:TPA: AbiV family abortive infection protein [Pseudomonas aeruginosa]|nr:AbiV family abortive infection protein [Pseudomonas aeruginosa]HBN8828940.1 AbiV family abortive infection protein [Pseudomonas aeruginosa]HBN9262399.1 AbiV family abortive infection protein [Pseudomonas aeruginosa]HEJ4475942.1 AbiV family abortive infection protein [Pseudomonas aeruginosa]HEK3340235.1 AbiV family abortive infection protein [Pseudomonas aeruginosa]